MITNSSAQFRGRRVDTLRDALEMRRVRNSCREFMTHNSNRIGLLQQIRWFYTTYARGWHPGFHAFLFRLDGKPVGYGIVREANERLWVTGGLVEGARSQGYGRRIFEFVTNLCHVLGHDAWLDVFRDNQPAVQLYYSLGYELWQAYDRPEDGKRILVMRKGRSA